MIVHKKTQLRKKYIHGRGLVIRLPTFTVNKGIDQNENAKKAASEIKYGSGFQVLRN